MWEVYITNIVMLFLVSSFNMSLPLTLMMSMETWFLTMLLFSHATKKRKEKKRKINFLLVSFRHLTSEYKKRGWMTTGHFPPPNQVFKNFNGHRPSRSHVKLRPKSFFLVQLLRLKNTTLESCDHKIISKSLSCQQELDTKRTSCKNLPPNFSPKGWNRGTHQIVNRRWIFDTSLVHRFPHNHTTQKGRSMGRLPRLV